MKVILPSLGILGTKAVDMLPVTFEIYRKLQDVIQEPNLAKYSFMHMLLPKVDFNQITKWDLDYLYTLAVFSATYNKVKFDVTCPFCGKVHSTEYVLDGEAKTLRSFKKVNRKTLHNCTLDFHIISAAQYEAVLEACIAEEDEQKAFEDHLASAILGVNPDKVPSLPVSVVTAAFMFQEMSFHGLLVKAPVSCPNCHRQFSTMLDLPISVLQMPMDKIMESYESVSDKLTFEDFNQMTIPEYDNYVTILNKQVEQ